MDPFPKPLPLADPGYPWVYGNGICAAVELTQQVQMDRLAKQVRTLQSQHGEVSRVMEEHAQLRHVVDEHGQRLLALQDPDGNRYSVETTREIFACDIADMHAALQVARGRISRLEGTVGAHTTRFKDLDSYMAETESAHRKVDALSRALEVSEVEHYSSVEDLEGRIREHLVLSNLAVETKAQDAVNSMMAEIDALGVQARDALDKVVGDQDAKMETLMETFSVKLGDSQSLLMERLSQVDKRVARLADTHDAKIEDYSARVTSSVLEEIVNLSKCFERTLSTTLNSVTPEDLPELSRAYDEKLESCCARANGLLLEHLARSAQAQETTLGDHTLATQSMLEEMERSSRDRDLEFEAHTAALKSVRQELDDLTRNHAEKLEAHKALTNSAILEHLERASESQHMKLEEHTQASNALLEEVLALSQDQLSKFEERSVWAESTMREELLKWSQAYEHQLEEHSAQAKSDMWEDLARLAECQDAKLEEHTLMITQDHEQKLEVFFARVKSSLHEEAKPPLHEDGQNAVLEELARISKDHNAKLEELVCLSKDHGAKLEDRREVWAPFEDVEARLEELRMVSQQHDTTLEMHIAHSTDGLAQLSAENEAMMQAHSDELEARFKDMIAVVDSKHGEEVGELRNKIERVTKDYQGKLAETKGFIAQEFVNTCNANELLEELAALSKDHGAKLVVLEELSSLGKDCDAKLAEASLRLEELTKFPDKLQTPGKSNLKKTKASTHESERLNERINRCSEELDNFRREFRAKLDDHVKNSDLASTSMMDQIMRISKEYKENAASERDVLLAEFSRFTKDRDAKFEEHQIHTRRLISQQVATLPAQKGVLKSNLKRPQDDSMEQQGKQKSEFLMMQEAHTESCKAIRMLEELAVSHEELARQSQDQHAQFEELKLASTSSLQDLMTVSQDHGAKLQEHTLVHSSLKAWSQQAETREAELEELIVSGNCSIERFGGDLANLAHDSEVRVVELREMMHGVESWMQDEIARMSAKQATEVDFARMSESIEAEFEQAARNKDAIDELKETMKQESLVAREMASHRDRERAALLECVATSEVQVRDELARVCKEQAEVFRADLARTTGDLGWGREQDSRREEDFRAMTSRLDAVEHQLLADAERVHASEGEHSALSHNVAELSMAVECLETGLRGMDSTATQRHEAAAQEAAELCQRVDEVRRMRLRSSDVEGSLILSDDLHGFDALEANDDVQEIRKTVNELVILSRAQGAHLQELDARGVKAELQLRLDRELPELSRHLGRAASPALRWTGLGLAGSSETPRSDAISELLGS
uniref:Uncharacterized protein n=2 Tax=Noctiluca scintillans TaxID=2966 RepID=A0A7S1ASV7_NOCSC|mmetsp:Transcript_58537/g.155824  ORF Transcript_58537/g.155824 Transcript_58537/m.155824 type:complete len:1299 (+) Transcript_58537:42-3938(+)